jgi:NAD(P)-dependent dehydrogenase (short-subunit alcohol dehydrogenase family)
VKTDASRLLPLPEKMDFVTGAAFLLTYATTDHALRDRGALAAGETLLVLGAAGGVGLAAIEVGKALGARVIACASSDDKLAVCRSHGADSTINYATEDLRERIKVLTDGRGVDVIYDPVGGPYSEPAFRSIAWRGRHLVVGFAAGDIPKLPLNLALLKGASVVGVFWATSRDASPRASPSVKQLTKWYAAGLLKPHVSETFPLEKAAEALKRMAARQVKESRPYGRLESPAFAGGFPSPTPSGRCMNTLSTQRPNLNPTERSVPTRRKPQAVCTPMEAAFALSPITAMSWRYPSASQRRTSSSSSIRPTPRPVMSCRT